MKTLYDENAHDLYFLDAFTTKGKANVNFMSVRMASSAPTGQSFMKSDIGRLVENLWRKLKSD
jgi:hypothetical protein